MAESESSACWNITLQTCGQESNCPECCDAELACDQYSVAPITGTENNLQVGDRLHFGIDCGEESIAEDGYYNDCINCPTFYGCIIVSGGLGIVSSIAVCTGSENTCGSGAGSICENSSTINSNVRLQWGGRNKISVSALDTWETLYESPNRFSYDFENDKFYEEPRMIYYIKQIWINNCYTEAEGNDKHFSVRLYNADIGYTTVEEEALVETAQPGEIVITNHLKLENGENKSILTYESPIKCNLNTDIIQIQSHTSLDGFNISVWLEEFAQGYDERDATKDLRKMTRYAQPGEVTSINSVPMKVGRGLTGTPTK